jgi:hypothetical protein
MLVDGLARSPVNAVVRICKAGLAVRFRSSPQCVTCDYANLHRCRGPIGALFCSQFVAKRRDPVDLASPLLVFGALLAASGA